MKKINKLNFNLCKMKKYKTTYQCKLQSYRKFSCMRFSTMHCKNLPEIELIIFQCSIFFQCFVSWCESTKNKLNFLDKKSFVACNWKWIHKYIWFSTLQFNDAFDKVLWPLLSIWQKRKEQTKISLIQWHYEPVLKAHCVSPRRRKVQLLW